MVPRSYYSFGVLFSLFTFFIGNYTNHSTQLLHPSDAKTEAITKIRSLLSTVSDQINIKDADFNLVTEDNKGVQVAGTATLFAIQHVNLVATVGNTLTEISATFPAGASHQIRISNQNLSDWLPDFLRNKLDLSQVKFQFFSQENNRLQLVATLAQPSGGNLVDYNGFKIQQPILTFSLARTGGAAPSTTATAALGGTLQLGILNFDLAAIANTNREWSFVGTLNQLKVTDLVRNVGSYLSINVPAMPGPIENFSIQQASIALNSDRSVRFKGACDIGKVEAYIAKQSGTTNFLFAIAPNTNYKLSDISNVLQPIDNLGLTDIAMVYSATTEKVEQELELLNEMQLGSQTVKAGLTLMGGFDIPANLPGMSQKGKVIMRATLPPSLTATPTLQAAVQFNGLQLGDAFKINEAFLQLAPVDVSFGAGLSIGAHLDDNWINFSGLGEIAAPATFSLSVFMEPGSIWKNPFGVKGVEIANMGLDVGADVLSPIPRPKLGVSGALKLGPFQGSGAGMLDTGNPLNSLISLKMNQIGMQEFINAFVSAQVRNEMNKLPAQLRDFGVRDAEVTVIPKTTEMAGRTYTQGLRLAGKANIAGLGARLDVNAGFDAGFSGVAAVSPILIREGNVTIFQLSGNNAADSARMAIDMTYNNFLQPKNPFYLIDGKVGLLGMSNQTKVEINKDGVYFYNKGNLFGKFQAELDAKGGNFNDVKGFYIRAAMKNELISYLNQQATSAIDAATKDSQNAYRKAKKDLADAEAYLRTTQKDVDAFNAHKKKVDAAQREVNKIRGDLDSAKRKCKKGNVIECGKVAGIEVAYHTATLTLEGYKKTLDGLSKAVDWSKRNIAANTVKLSGEIVKGFETASTGSMQAAKWIVDKGLGGVVDVKSAEFAGRLDAVKGGNVSMAVNVKFLNDSHHAGFAFNFNDPASGAKALADLLLNNRAPSGDAPTFGGQIGQRNYDTSVPNNPNANTGAVNIYQNYNYGGASFTLTEGRYDMNVLVNSIGNDQLSSIKVPSGYRVTLFEHAGFQGRTKVITSDNPTISDFNDFTSSMIVEKITMTIEVGKYYYIQAKNSGKYLNIAAASLQNGATLVQNDVMNTQFTLESVGDGYYVITVKNSGKALDVNGGSTADGQAIIQWDTHKGANQQFKLEPTGDGYYIITAKHSGKVWDVNGGSTANNIGIIQWTKHGGDNQQFKLVSAN